MKHWLMAFLLLWMAHPLCAQDTVTMSVEECVKNGLRQHAIIASSTEKVKAAEAREREFRSRLYPSFGGRASYLRLSANIPDFTFELPPGLFPGLDTEGFSFPALLNRYEASVSMEQPLFAGRQINRRLKAAGYRSEAARQQLQRSKNEWAFRIREAYWSLYERQHAMNVVETALEQVEEQLRVVQEMRKRGMALESDVLSLKTRRSEVRLQHIEAEQAVALARLTLNYRTGLNAGDRLELASEPVQADQDRDVEVLKARARSMRPELRAVESENRAARAELKAAKGGLWPRVSAVGRYLYARPNTYFVPQQDRFDWSWEAGLVLSMDLWSWGARRQRVAAARAENRQLQYLREDLKAQVDIEVMRALQLVERSEEAVKVARNGVEQGRASYRIMQERFKQGMALTSELLEAESAYRRAELQRIRAETGYEQARAALEFAIGDMPPETGGQK